jgi:SAM-dependent methyltransferase
VIDPEEERSAARERWEATAPRWEAGVDAYQQGALPVAHWMVDKLQPQPGQTVLELAAGRGDVGLLAAELLVPGGRLILTDGAEAMVDVAKRYAASRGLPEGLVEFKPMELEWVDEKLATVDGILCRFGYQHAVDPEAALREARRVLKPGGKVVLAVWSPPSENPWLAALPEAAEELGFAEPAAPDAPLRPPGGRRLRRPRHRADRPHVRGALARRLVGHAARVLLHHAPTARRPLAGRPLPAARRGRGQVASLRRRGRLRRHPGPRFRSGGDGVVHGRSLRMRQALGAVAEA